jgi:Holliday junction DNA helicase RuvA
LELRDKITKERFSDASFAGFAPGFEGGAMSGVSEAVAALVVLGFTQSEAASAVAKLDAKLPVEELIKRALGAMSQF